jgi:hypothetical protein
MLVCARQVSCASDIESELARFINSKRIGNALARGGKKQNAPGGRVSSKPGTEKLRFRGWRFGFGFGVGFFAFEVSLAATTFLDFVMLLSHISLLCGIDSVVYRDEYEDLATEHQRHFLRAGGDLLFERLQDDRGKEAGQGEDVDQGAFGNCAGGTTG